MDGHRSTAEIADLVSAEYLIDIDQAWVDRLVTFWRSRSWWGNSKQHSALSIQPVSSFGASEN